MINRTKIAFICFYNASKGGYGAAEITKDVYKYFPERKKIFETNDFNNFYFNNLNKFFHVFIFFFKVHFFFKKIKKKILFIEGASWIFYPFFLILLTKICRKKWTIIYRAHNFEYDLRLKKNNFFISYISKIMEKFVYQNSNVGTVVSYNDYKKIKNLYKVEPYIFSNGVDIKKETIKTKLPKSYYVYSGSYDYNPNKKAIDTLIKDYFPLIKKKFPKTYLIIISKVLPNQYKNIEKLIHLSNLEKKKYNYVIKKSQFLLLPLISSPGTKLKIIEGLVFGKQIFTTKYGVKGIDIKFKDQPYIFKSKTDLINKISYIIKKKKFFKEKLLKSKREYIKIYSIQKILDKFIKHVNF